MIRKSICLVLAFTLFMPSLSVFAESVDDKMTETAPGSIRSQGEFVHGAGHGKLLMRILMFGSVPQQGVHFMPEGTDLLFAMLYAGGVSDSTRLDGITIRRRNMKPLMEVNLESLLEKGREVPKLYDGDIVTVPYNWRRDISTIGLVTGFITAMTGFTLSIIALSK